MPATGATRKEPENSVNPGGRPGFGKGGCSDAAAGLQQRSFREGARRSRSGLSNGPEGLKWLLRTRVSARSFGIRRPTSCIQGLVRVGGILMVLAEQSN